MKNIQAIISNLPMSVSAILFLLMAYLAIFDLKTFDKYAWAMFVFAASCAIAGIMIERNKKKS